MTPAIDITAEQQETILSLLERYLPGTTAWACGSRVRRKSRPASDLDLVVFSTPEQDRRVGDLREAFEEGDLPFPVDLFVWDEIPENFRERIEAERVVLVEKQERDVGGDWPTARLAIVSRSTIPPIPRKRNGRSSIIWIPATSRKTGLPKFNIWSSVETRYRAAPGERPGRVKSSIPPSAQIRGTSDC